MLILTTTHLDITLDQSLFFYFFILFYFYYFYYFYFILFNFIHFTLVLVTWSHCCLFVCFRRLIFRVYEDKVKAN